MLRNYLTATLRNLARNKLYAAINILGLAVGFCAVMLIVLFVRDEITFDTWVPGHENIYRAAKTGFPQNGPTLHGIGTSQIEALWMRQDIPEIKTAARLWPETRGFRSDEMEANTTVIWADPEILELFPFIAVDGDLKSALTQPDSLVLTRSAARRFFGRERVVGELIEIDRKTVMRIVAVMEDLPKRSHLNIEILGAGSTSLSPFMAKYPEDLNFGGGYTYVKIDPGSLSAVHAALQEMVSRHISADGYIKAGIVKPGAKAGDFYVYTLQPLASLHLISQEGNFPSPHYGLLNPSGDAGLLRALAMTGAFILFLAIANFVNLMTARASRRAVEVGIRKTTGAYRRDLISQFLGESFLYAGAGLIAAVAAVATFLPRFNAFLDRDIGLDHGLVWLAPIGGLIFIFTGILGGLYPAFVLSSYRPASVLKGNIPPTRRSALLRRSLVIAQFAILIGLVVSTLVIGRQTEFALRNGLRLETDQLLTITTPCDASFKTQVSAIPGVRGAACANGVLFGGPAQIGLRTLPDGTRYNQFSAGVEAGFLELYGLKPLAGQFFPEGSVWAPPPQEGPEHRRFVINETTLRALGFESPEAAVGQAVPGGQPTDEIIGVVADFPYQSLRQPINAMIFRHARDYSTMVVKLDKDRIGETLAAIDRAWETLGTGRPITRQFYDQQVEAKYVDIIQQSRAFSAFSTAAIFVACLGLFGLSAFTAEQRTKEIGVRKAMGATRRDILGLVLWQFAKPVLWANLIAWPSAYLIMQRWLESFAYRIELAPWMFLAATTAALAIALLTVIGHALLVARAHPVSALRYE